MRILYVSQYFPPEVNAPAQRVIDFSKAWKAAGHDVTVLTGFPNHPAGILYDGYKLKLIQREIVEGIDVVRTYLYPAANKKVLKRCINYTSFMASAALIGCSAVGKVDVVIASSPQLLVGLAGYFISRIKRVPFVLEVRDVWPEALLAVNAGLNRHFYNALDRIADFLYKHADKIVTVTRGAQEAIMKHGVPKDKLTLIPSGINIDEIKPMDPPQDIRKSFGNGESVIVSYIGTHGMAQKLSTVLEAAQQISDRRVQFILIGDGAEKEDLIQLKERMQLDNVHFLEQLPQEEALRYLSASDICVVPLRKAELFKQTVPSKMYEIMASGRPMILGVDGEARELLENASAGIFVEPENARQLADAVSKLAKSAEMRNTYGINGRNFIEMNYNKSTQSSTYLRMLSTKT